MRRFRLTWWEIGVALALIAEFCIIFFDIHV